MEVELLLIITILYEKETKTLSEGKIIRFYPQLQSNSTTSLIIMKQSSRVPSFVINFLFRVQAPMMGRTLLFLVYLLILAVIEVPG